MVAALIVTAITWTMVSLVWTHALLIFAGVLSIVSNLTAMIRFSHWQLLRIAGHLTHLGFGIMVLGILASSGYASSEQLKLLSGESASAYGYDITFVRRVEEEDVEKSHLEVTLARGNETIVARPRLYISPYNGQEMRSPFLRRGFFDDLYLSPLEYRRLQPENVLYMTKGEPVAYGDWSLTFERFDVGSHAQSGAMRVGAVITAVSPEDSVEFTPILESSGSTRKPIPTALPGTDLTFALQAMSVEQRLIELLVDDPAALVDDNPGELLFADISRKPLIGLVWTGTVVIIIGVCLSYWRRRKEADLMD